MPVLANRARMSTSTTGTGTLTLGSPSGGFQSFADAGIMDGNTVRYVIEDINNEYEIGLGVYTASGTTLTRTPSESSNGGAAINLTGNAVVFISAGKEELQRAANMDQNVATTDSPAFAGVTVNGNITVTGTVDGRDVATDGSKLDGIEAGADVTDTTNVTAAGALMDSELTDITAVKALNQGVATTDSPSFAGLTATTADINGGTIDGVTLGTNSAVTEAQIDNLNLNGNSIISTNTDGNIALTPNGTGEVDISKVDIDGGTIDGTVIGGSTPAAISGTTGSFSGDVSIADKIVHTGDTDTAIRFPAADTVTVETAGTERVRIDASGNVGIGGAPTQKFDVFGGAGAAVSIVRAALAQNAFFSVSGNGNTFLSTSFDMIQDTSNAATLTNRANAPLIFGTNNTERMRIDASGNVGIGTSSPLSTLDISAGANNTYLRINDTRASAPYVGSESGAMVFGLWGIGERARIDSSGNVGIGTSSPVSGYRLNVVNDSGNSQQLIRAGTNFNSTIAFADQDSSTSGQLIYAHNGDYMAFNTNASERMRITSTGLVGIGASSLGDATLEIRPASDIPQIKLTQSNVSDGGDGWKFHVSGPTGGDLAFIREISSSDSERMRITSTGLVGIGTSSPAGKLDVSQSTAGTARHYLRNTSSSVGAYTILDLVNDTGNNISEFFCTSSTNTSSFGTNATVLQAATSNPLIFGTNGTERARIDASGNLIVGLTTHFGSGKVAVRYTPGVTTGVSFYPTTDASTPTPLIFLNSSGSAVGSVVTSASATAYNTSSDYRLKENVVPLAGASDRLMQIPVCRFNFIADPDTTVDGFLAHEVQAFVPEAVTGEKDGEEMQAIDHSKLVPLLTAALQEALKRIAVLEEKCKA